MGWPSHNPPRETREVRRRVRWLCLVLAVIFCGPARATPWYEHFQRGEQALKARDWDEAIEQLILAIEKNPRSQWHVRTTGMLFVDYHPYLSLGIAYYNNGQLEAALQAFRIEEDYQEVVRSFSDLNNLRAFQDLATKALNSRDSGEDARRGFVAETLETARSLEEAGRLEEALSALNRVIAAEPGNASATAAMQRLSRQVADIEQQRETEQRASVLLEQGRALLSAGNVEEASSAFRESLSLLPSQETQRLLDEALERLRTAVQAEKDAEKRRRMVVEAIDEAGRLESAGDLTAALNELETVLALDGANQRARAMQSRILRVRQAEERERNQARQIATLLGQSADLIESGKLEDAAARLNLVLALDADNTEARTRLQQVLQRIEAARPTETTGPTRPRLPPAIALLNTVNAVAATGQKPGGEPEGEFAEERVTSPRFVLAGMIVDDAAELKVVFLKSDEAASGEFLPFAEETLSGERMGENLYRFRFSRSLTLDAGVSRWKVVANDRDGLSGEIIHQAFYARPWFRSPWALGGFAFAPLAAIGVYLGYRARRRNRLLKRRFNPYQAGTPVLKEDLFVGRQRLMTRVLQALHNNSLLLYGERRIGKTSFQHGLKRRLVELNDPEYAFFPVYIDLEGTSEDRFFALLAHEVFEELSSLLPENMRGRGPQEGAPYGYRQFVRDIRDVIRALQAQSTKTIKLVLLLDEVDELNHYDPKINQRLRSLFMKSFAESLAAVVTGVGIKKHWESEGSPWYNFFEEIQVKPFGREDAIELIRRPIAGVFALEDGAIERILARTECKPYLIQKLCLGLVNRLHEEKRRKITVADVDAAQQPVIQ